MKKQQRLAALKRFKTVFEEIKEMMSDCSGFSITGFVDTPRGTRQNSDSCFFDHEYVDQRTGPCGDDCSGTMYFPANKQYIAVEFWC